MSRFLKTLPLVAMFTAALTAVPLTGQVPLEGQMPGIGGPRLLRIGFGGGMTVPVGDTEEAWNNGLNGQAFLLLSPPFLPTIRLNLGYEKFDFKEAVVNAVTGQTSVMSGVAGIFMPLFGIGPLTPYVSAGLGAFRIDESFETGVDPEAAFHFGIDGGAGVQLRIGRLEGFVEGRVKNVYTDEGGMIDTSAIRYIPVTFGLLF